MAVEGSKEAGAAVEDHSDIHTLDERAAKAKPPAAFFELEPAMQAATLRMAMPSLNASALESCIRKLRSGTPAPAAPRQRIDIRALGAASLRNGLVFLAQEDAGASLGLEGTGISSTTTWSLAEDGKMRSDPTLLRETTDDPQFQHLWGKKSGVPVLTGQATGILHSMLQNGDGPLEHFHTLDIVSATPLRTNVTNTNGTYMTPDNLNALESPSRPSPWASSSATTTTACTSRKERWAADASSLSESKRGS